MIDVDGSYLEGGGQILRTATALASVTKKPCRVFNIRQGREKPGLGPQHLLGLQALAKFCNGRLEGDYLGSQEIKFYPGKIYKDRISVSIPTAGSITLILETLIPAALFAPFLVKINFEGGATDTFFSPTIDYFRYVFLRILEKFGAKTEINIFKRGYYPEGGAKIEVKAYPSKLKKVDLVKRGELEKILVISGADLTLKNKKVAERQIAGVREILGKLKLPIKETIEYYDTQSPGSQVCLLALFENTVIGVDNFGKLGKRAEDVGRETALELLKEQKSGACLDKHLADQILPYMALTGGELTATVSEITNHCKTNMWVIKKFINGNFEIKENSIDWSPY